jgi:hypothetical protein
MPHPSWAVLTAPFVPREVTPLRKQTSKIAPLPASRPVKRLQGQLHLPVFVWPR